MKSIFQIAQGYIKKLARGKEEEIGYTDLREAIDDLAKDTCCGPDCCDGNLIIRWRDQVPSTGRAKYISYIKNGTLVTVTEAVYLADKAAGFV